MARLDFPSGRIRDCRINDMLDCSLYVDGNINRCPLLLFDLRRGFGELTMMKCLQVSFGLRKERP